MSRIPAKQVIVNISKIESDLTISGSLIVSGGAADFSDVTEAIGFEKLGIFTSSIQVDHDTTTNFVAAEHFTSGSITEVGTIVSGSVKTILPQGSISSSTQFGPGDNVTFGTINVTDVSGSFSGSFSGDGSGLTGTTADAVPGTVSGSIQVDHDATTNFVAAEHFTSGSISDFGTIATGNVATILPVGSVSGSIQIDHDATINFVEAEHFTSGSITDFGTIATGNVDTILPTGTISGSGQLPVGSVSGSTQVNHDQTTNFVAAEHFTSGSITEFGAITSGNVDFILPTGTISSSTQFDSGDNVTFGVLNVTEGSGSFSGSFTGDGSNLTGLAPAPGTVSGSIQIDHDATTNFAANEHFTSGSITEFGAIVTGNVDSILPVGTISGSEQLPAGSVSGSVQIDHNTTTNYIADEHINHTVVSLSLAGTANEIEITGSGGDISTSRSWTIGLPDNVSIADGLTVTNDITASNGYFSGNVDVDGIITALEFHTTFVSSSILYQSGSTKFGDTLDDVHERTGSLNITGSLSVVGTSDLGIATAGDITAIIPLGTVSGSDQLPTGTVSGSVQIDHDATTNFLASEHFTSGSITEFGTIVTGNVDSILPLGTISGSAQFPVGSVSGSIQVDHDQTTNFAAAEHFTSGSITEFGTIVTGNVDTILPLGTISGSAQLPVGSVSGSIQVDHDATTNFLASEHFTSGSITEFGTIVVGSVNSILPLGTISSSAQFGSSDNVTFGVLNIIEGSGSFSGSFAGDGSNLTGTSADPSPGTVSGSIQVDHDATTNFVAAEHFTSGSITEFGTIATGNVDTILPIGTISGSAQLPSGSVSGSIQVDHNTTTNFVAGEHFLQSAITTVGIVTIGNVNSILPLGTISSSAQFGFGDNVIFGTLNVSEGSGSFSGSFYGDGQGLTGIGGTPSPGTVSSSIQVDHDATTNFVAAEHFTSGSITEFGTIIAGNVNTILPIGTISSSLQFGSGDNVTFGILNVTEGSGSFSGSFSGDGQGLTGIGGTPSPGTVSGSIQIDHDATTNFLASEHFTSGSITEVGTIATGNVDAILPIGTVSGSAQFGSGDNVTFGVLNVTEGSGSFSGSFTGDGAGLTGVVASAALGTVSGSIQVDHDATLNFVAAEHFTSGSIIEFGTIITGNVDTILPLGTMSGSAQLPLGSVSGSIQVDHDATTNFLASEHFTSGSITEFGTIIAGNVDNILPINIISSSLQFGSSDNVTFGVLNVTEGSGSFSGSFTGDGSNLTGTSADPSPGTVSGSIQIDHDSTTNFLASEHFTSGSITEFGTIVTGNVRAITLGYISGSIQIDHDATTNFLASEHFTSGSITEVGTIIAGNVDSILPSGTISSSNQFGSGDNVTFGIFSVTEGSGSFSGSFAGDGSNLTGISATPGTMSGSIQVDHDATTNFLASEHFTSGSITEFGTIIIGNVDSILPIGTMSGSSQLPAGSVSASIQIDHDITTNFLASEHFTSGSITEFGTIVTGNVDSILPSGIVSSSNQFGSGDNVIFGILNVTEGSGSFSGSFTGDGSNLTGTSADPSPGTVSSSIQIDHDSTTNFLANEHFTSGSITEFGTIIAGNVDSILPLGTISGSAQLPAGSISGSVQVDHNATTNYVLNEHINHTAVSLSLSGTANEIEITGSGGDISTSRSWTVGLPDNVSIADGLTVTNNITASNGYFSGNVDVGGIITALEFHTTFVSSSIIYQSGSTKFGDTLDDVHERTGSMDISGSLLVIGNITGSDVSASSIYMATASFADATNTNFVTVHAPNNVSADYTLVWPDNSGVSRQTMMTDGDGNLTFNFVDRVHAHARNVSGVTLNPGDPVFISGYNIGNDVFEIDFANAATASMMPVIGLVREIITNNSNGQIVISGVVENLDTTAWTIGQPLYVGSGSIGLTNAKPTGSNNLIQNIGYVLRVHAVTGAILAVSSGRPNDIPNIEDGYIWLGSAGSPTATDFTASIKDKLNIDGVFSGSAQLPLGTVSASIQIDHDATTNFLASEHFISGSITEFGTIVTGNVDSILPTGIISGSSQLPAGSVSASIQVDHDATTNFLASEHFTSGSITEFGTIVTGNVDNILSTGIISSSNQFGSGDNVTFGTLNVTEGSGSFSGSFTGDGSNLTGTSADPSPGTVSGSIQIDHDSTTNFLASEHFTSGSITEFGTIIAGNVDTILPIDIISGSVQVDHNSTTNYSASRHFLQTDITTIGTITVGSVDDILPQGTISGSSQLPAGSVSSSIQVDHDATTNFLASEHFTSGSITEFGTIVTGNVNPILPAGSISSSAQFDSGDSVIFGTLNITEGSGSFSGSFTGDGSSLSGVMAAADPGTVSGSIQVDHNVTTNFVANEHINHTAVSLSLAGTANEIEITGSDGDISTSRSWTIGLPNDVVVNSIAVGTNPSSGGIFRMGNNQAITGRNQANTSNITLWKLNLSDIIELGTTMLAGSIEFFAGNDLGTTTTPVRYLYVSGVRADDGVGSAPSLTFDSEVGLGWYRRSAGVMGLAGGSLLPEIDSNFDLGSTAVRWANIWADTIVVTEGSGSFSGSFTGDGSNLTGVAADPGTVSGSIQVDHDATTNFAANEHFTSGSITEFGTIVTGNVDTILPIDIISGSVQVDHDATTNFAANEHFTSASITEFGTIIAGSVNSILPAGSVSGSIQIDHDATTNFLANEHFTSGSITEFGTVVTGNVDTILPLGTISGSAQLPAGSISGSVQVDHNTTTNYVANEHINHTAVSLTLAGTANEIEVTGSGGDISTSRSWTVGLPDNVTIADGLTITNNITASDGYFSGNIDVDGIITALEFHTTFVSSSIVYQSGSTKFGDTLDDVHERTGSLNVTGSFTLDGTSDLGTAIAGDISAIIPTGTISGSAQLPAGSVSGSAQIDHDVTTNFLASEHFTSGSITEFGTIIAGNVDSILPLGTISGSSQLPAGSVSGSTQVDHDLTTNFLASEHFNSGSITEFGTIVTGNVNFILPAGSISSSAQFGSGDNVTFGILNVTEGSGSFSGSFVGDGSNLTGVAADPGTVSGSIQINHDATTNYSASRHFLQSEITTVGTVTAGNVDTILSLGTISGSAQLPVGSVSGSIQIDHDATTNFLASEHFTSGSITEFGTIVTGNVDTILPSGTISSSLQFGSGDNVTFGILNVTEGSGSFSGSFVGDGSNLSGVMIVADPGTVSSSIQVNHDATTNFLASEHFTSGSITEFSTIITGNVDSILPLGTMSGSSQLPAGSISGSIQIDHDVTTNFLASEHFTSGSITEFGTIITGNVNAILPIGTMSGSSQLPVGSVSGSIQIDHDATTNFLANEHFTSGSITEFGTIVTGNVDTILPTGMISSSAQFDTTDNVTFGTVDVSGSIFESTVNDTINSGSIETAALINTGSYQAAFFDYVVVSESNQRAGTVVSTWNAGNVQFTDTSTTDIGDTSGVVLAVDVFGANARLRVDTNTNLWYIKVFTRGL